MLKFRATVLSFLSFSGSFVYHTHAAQMEFDRMSPEPKIYSLHQQRLASPSIKDKKQALPQTLTIKHPILAEELHQLKDPNLTEIHLTNFCVGHLEDNYFIEDSSIQVTTETINSAVEVLSLKRCGLTDDHMKGITGFKSLKELYLESNHLTDQTAILLAGMKGLKSISLALNKDISNDTLRALLAMPNLEKLDVSFNKKIDNEGGELILKNDKKIEVDVRQTSISTRMQLEIRKQK